MVMYVKTRTGSWAPHKETPTGKTKTGIPLYTLNQAIQLGYKTPEPKPKLKFRTNEHISVYIDTNKPIFLKESIQIGKIVYSDCEEPIEFFHTPSLTLNSYKEKDSNKYLARRFGKNSKNQWIFINYNKGVAKEGAPIPRRIKENKDGAEEVLSLGYFTNLEIKEHTQSVRDDLLDLFLQDFQTDLINLAEGTLEIDFFGKPKKVLKAPAKAVWLQDFYNKRIESSQRHPEWYKFYQTWSKNRFEGDEKLFESLKIWALQDAHLVKIEEAHRKKWINRRNDFYKKLAYRLTMEAKNKGSIKIYKTEIITDKPVMMTEDKASNHRKRVSNVASNSFIEYLKKCAARENVLLEVNITTTD